MRVLNWDVFTGARPLVSQPVAMTIGVFDGIHQGHRALVESITGQEESSPAVITFRHNPRIFLKPHLYPGDIFTLQQKLQILEELGIETVILIDFSSDFSKLSCNDFVTAIRQSCDIRYLTLGDNFRCGRNGASSAYDVRDYLESHGVTVHIEAPVSWNGATLSSTRIRAAIREGKLEEAREMMGRDFVLDMGVSHVHYQHNTVRVEKMSLSQVLPPPGSYRVNIETPTQKIPTHISIDEEEIRWNQQEENESVKAIRFTETNDEGETDAH